MRFPWQPRVPADYDGEYFRAHSAGSLDSARVVVPLLVDLLAPRSVLDVGCGSGEWLRVFCEHGVTDVMGVDGSSASSMNGLPPERLRTADLENGFDLGRIYDLVLCLDVAEHLSSDAADRLVDSLTRHGNAVVFSAAVPGQRGLRHVNEQWLEYWVDRFSNVRFNGFDVIRPRIWQNESVEYWYRQNIVLFVNHAAVELHKRVSSLSGWALSPRSLVHPELLKVYVAEAAHVPQPREAVYQFLLWAASWVRPRQRRPARRE